MKLRLLAFALLLSAAAPPVQPAANRTSPPRTLRVGLWTLWHDKQLSIAPIPGDPATIYICAQPDQCSANPLRQPIQIAALSNRLQVASKPATSIEISGSVTLSAHKESLALPNPLRISARNGILILSVTLPIETYVERVVASESGPADTLESLKALAIVVRSFALHQPHGHPDYDLCDSTHCQLLHWSNSASQQHAAHAATLQTAGETLWYHGYRASAWFHQNCGGRTASPSEVWPATSLTRQAADLTPWLISQSDPYCSAHGAREWSSNLTLADLTAALASAGLVAPGWTTLSITQRGPSGRAVKLLVGSTQISAEDFRLAIGRSLGWNKILSTWFEVSRQESQPVPHFLFHGRGSGHGVGLCQAGAAAMSALGKDSNQILAQYFPGAVVADEATGNAWLSIRGDGFLLQTTRDNDAILLPRLNQAIAEAKMLSGLQPSAPIVLRAFPTTTAFRDATLAPGWVAAFTEGNWIATQPLSTLAARNLLAPVLKHEFLHALVESQAAPNTPLWLREGLVEAWSGPPQTNPTARPASPALDLNQLDAALAHPANEAQSQAAHQAAASFTQGLLNRYGRDQVLAWLHTGLPPRMLTSNP